MNLNFRLFFAGLISLLVVLGTTSCATQPPARSAAQPFAQALTQAIDDLFTQTSKLPAFMVKLESKLKQGKIVVDPLLDGTTGQQTELTKQAELQVVQRVKDRFTQFEILRFNASELGNAQYVLTGTLTRTKDGNERGQYRLSLALTDVKSQIVVAQTSAPVSDTNLDASPTTFYRDSPALAKDRGVEGYIRTTETHAGSPADPVYLERLPTSALVADAITAYDAGRYGDALALYDAASKRADGQQLRILNGIYLCHLRLQHNAEAEQAFGAIVRLGLVTNNLSLKILFKPGSVDYINDPKISAPYAMWLRQISRQTARSGLCITVVGHTSRTGSESTNERLSAQRASSVRKALETESRELVGKLREIGMGSRENIIGTATDDARDALDRRVEFRTSECK